MATPFPFTSGQTLTAAQMNAITTLPTTTKTASHTLVIADQGTRVIMNSASATTITVNTSIFGASDVVEIQNIGAGVCTVTAGTCTVSSAGPLAIPQHGGGQLVFSSASAATFFPTAVTVASQAFTAKAYCYFSGTGTPSIFSSVNISSITDNGVGDYTFNFTTAIGTGNYLWLGNGGKAGGPPSAANSSFCMLESPTGLITSAFIRLVWINANGTHIDTETNTMAVFV